MFGRTRRLATEHTINMLRPLIGVLQHSRGLPQGFWRDDYVLGFIGFLISFHATVTSGRKLSQEDKGRVLFDTFTALSNMNGLEIGRQYSNLASSLEKSDAFELGADNAAACAFISIGKVSDQSQPYYEKAKSLATAQGNPNDLAAISGNMLHELWIEEINRRFP